MSSCQIIHNKIHTNPFCYVWVRGPKVVHFILSCHYWKCFRNLCGIIEGDRQTNGDRGFAMLWAFNLSKWHQGLEPACLIILKLNLGQRMTQTCVFIKACLGSGSFVFMQHALLCLCHAAQLFAFSGCIFHDRKEEMFKAWLTNIWLCIWSLIQSLGWNPKSFEISLLKFKTRVIVCGEGILNIYCTHFLRK